MEWQKLKDFSVRGFTIASVFCSTLKKSRTYSLLFERRRKIEYEWLSYLFLGLLPSNLLSDHKRTNYPKNKICMKLVKISLIFTFISYLEQVPKSRVQVHYHWHLLIAKVYTKFLPTLSLGFDWNMKLGISRKINECSIADCIYLSRYRLQRFFLFFIPSTLKRICSS